MSMVNAEKRTFSERFILFFDRWTPNSMVFAFLLTILVGILALLLTDSPLLFDAGKNKSLVNAWTGGFWNLLTFGMQMSLIMITGSIVATAPPMKKFLRSIAQIPESAFAAVFMVMMVTGVVYWIHWGVGMMVSINLGREILAASKEKGYKIHAPAFVALSYSTFAAGVGLSQAAPILGATPGALKGFVASEAAKAYVPDVVPLTLSVLSPVNLAQCALILAAVVVVGWLLYPKKESQIVEISQALLDDVRGDESTQGKRPKATTPAEWINTSPILNYVVGAFGMFWIIMLLKDHGFQNISINSINFILLMLGVILCRDPETLCNCAIKATSAVWGIILQFPFYAGIFGLIAYTGLSEVIVNFFMSFATAKSFPTIAYLYSAILNMAVPSGGSKFAIEAPYLLDVCAQLNIEVEKILLAYTYGDQTTNIIQPFWALPFMSLYKLEFKNILPYAMIVCCATLVICCVFTGFIY